MANKKLNELSNEVLLKMYKSSKVITYMLAGTLLVLFCVTTIAIFMGDFNTSMLILVALLPILLVNFRNLNEIKKELESRKLT
jgi:predicted signal transduction protein with EAL and GGDEF domain